VKLVTFKLDGLERMGAELPENMVSQFTALVASEVTKWAKVAKESGATAD
jgi:hypothetical protein